MAFQSSLSYYLEKEMEEGMQALDSRNIGIDIIASREVNHSDKEKVIKFAQSLDPSIVFRKKISVKFVGQFPTYRIRIAFRLTRNADVQSSMDYLRVQLHGFMQKNPWIKRIEVNQIQLMVKPIFFLGNGEGLDNAWLVNKAASLMKEMAALLQGPPSDTEQISKVRALKDEISALIGAIVV